MIFRLLPDPEAKIIGLVLPPDFKICPWRVFISETPPPTGLLWRMILLGVAPPDLMGEVVKTLVGEVPTLVEEMIFIGIFVDVCVAILGDVGVDAPGVCCLRKNN